MIYKKLLSAAAVAAALVGGHATAAPVVVDTSTFAPAWSGGDADSLTAPAAYFGLNWSATSTYTDNTTNVYGNVGTLGVGDYVADSGSGTVTLLNSANGTLSVNASEGLGAVYGMRFSYSNLMGIVAGIQPLGGGLLGIGAFYGAGGLINLYADTTDDGNGDFDNSDDVLLMTLEVLGSSGGIGNFSLYTQVQSVLADTFFIAGLDIGDIVAINGVEATANFNNAGGTPTQIDDSPLTWERSSVLNGNVEFAVPEPGVLALLGLGFAGLGFARRNKKTA